MKFIYKNDLHDTHRRLTRILIHEIRYNTFQNDPLQVCESAVNIKMARKPILCQSVGWFEGQLLIDLSLLSSLLLSCLLHHYAAVDMLSVCVCCKSTGFSFKHSINSVQSRDGLACI